MTAQNETTPRSLIGIDRKNLNTLYPDLDIVFTNYQGPLPAPSPPKGGVFMVASITLSLLSILTVFTF